MTALLIQFGLSLTAMGLGVLAITVAPTAAIAASVGGDALTCAVGAAVIMALRSGGRP